MNRLDAWRLKKLAAQVAEAERAEGYRRLGAHLAMGGEGVIELTSPYVTSTMQPTPQPSKPRRQRRRRRRK